MAAQIDEQIKFLSFAGLLTYDEKIKEVIAAGDLANSTELSETIGALDYTIPSGNHTEGKAVVAVSETDGIISVTEGNVNSDYIVYTPQVVTPAVGTQGEEGYEAAVYDTNETTIQGAVAEIYDKIADNAEAGEVAVYQGSTKVNAIAADGNTYTIKQGSGTVATINIARDMVVSSGSVVSYTSEQISALTDVPNGTTLNAGEKYVKLVIANATDGKNIYIAVQDLYDDYTFTDGDEIDFTELNNEVTAVIKTGSIAKTKLTTSLLNEITSARTTITEVSQTNPATKHILVTKTAGTGANPDNYVISENDIASATNLTAEISRSQTAEGEIAGKIGLTGNEGSKVYSTNIGGNTVVADMNLVDGRLDDLETSVSNIGVISTADINGLFSSEGD